MGSLKASKGVNLPPLRIWIILLLVCAAILLAYHLRFIFNPLLVALGLAYIFNPLFSFLQRYHIPRVVSVLMLYLGVIGIIFGFFYFIMPKVADQVSHLATEIQQSVQRWQEDPKFQRILKELEKVLIEQKERIAEAAATGLGFVLKGLGTGIKSMFGILSYILLVPLYMFFISRNMDKIWIYIKSHIPASHRERVIEGLVKIHRTIASYFRGQITIALTKGILLITGLGIAGVPYFLLFGVIYGVGCMLPYVGVLVTLFSMSLVIILTFGFGGTLLVGLLILAGIEILDSLLLTPTIMGRQMGLHPVEIILSILIGGELFGFFGLLIAIPLAASLKIVVTDFLIPYLKGAG
jgi:predicted PurR-regulated permease PerM